MRSRGITPFLFTTGGGLVARNSGLTEFNQSPPDLPDRVLPGVPRPFEGGQRDGQDPSREEFQQDMRDTQEQGPAAYALPRAALIVAQAQLFDFVEVDFNLAATR